MFISASISMSITTSPGGGGWVGGGWVVGGWVLDFTRLMLILTQVDVLVEVVVEVGVELGISFTQCSPPDGSVSG